MASNSFGTIFRITTWGESHGPAIGVIIDGCPAGLVLSDEDINTELAKRRPGASPYTSPRKEADHATISSGVFEGKTTGAPLSIIIPTTDARPSAYEGLKDLLRPGHGNYTYLEKYGCFDYRGGGRASARETACRVAAGAVAKKILTAQGISLRTRLVEVGGIAGSEEAMLEAVLKAKQQGDSLGGIVECCAEGLPAGLGDPVYDKLEAKLAQAMLSLPASKGFEIGEGFAAARMRGSEHNDSYYCNEQGIIRPSSNHAGGTLAGISTGLPLVFRVAFKPTSTIGLSQTTVDLRGTKQEISPGPQGRHDPCVAIRAVLVVEAMAALVLVDALLMQRCARIEG